VAKEDPSDKSDAVDLCFERLYDYDKDLKKCGVGEMSLLCVEGHRRLYRLDGIDFLTLSFQFAARSGKHQDGRESTVQENAFRASRILHGSRL